MVLKCRCESSRCDHGDDIHVRIHACERPADPRLYMMYVVHTCTQCAANMVASGGEDYIHLAKASRMSRVHPFGDKDPVTYGCDYCPATITSVEHNEGGLCRSCREDN